MELTIAMKMGDEELLVKAVTLKEILQITSWTGYENKTEWLQAVQSEAPLALQAAYALAVWRKTGQKPRLDDLDFDLDTLDSRFVDETGQTVELVFEENDDGTLKTDKDNKPIPVLDSEGRMQFRYSETKELIRPTEAPAATSTTRRSSGKSSESPSPTLTSVSA